MRDTYKIAHGTLLQQAIEAVHNALDQDFSHLSKNEQHRLKDYLFQCASTIERAHAA